MKSTFLFLSVLILFCIVSCIDNPKNHNESNKKIREALNSYTQYAKKNPDNSSDSNYNALASTMQTEIDKTISNSNKADKPVAIKIKQIYFTLDSMNKSWLNAFSEMKKPDIMDFSMLKTTKEIDRQIIVIQEYINQSKNNKDFFTNRINMVNNRISDLDQNNKMLIGFKKGINLTQKKQAPIYTPYIIAHIEYGEKMKKMLLLLKKDFGKWESDSEGISFENDSTLNKYQILYNEYISINEKINILYDKLLSISLI